MNSSASRRNDLQNYPTQTLISRHSSFLPIPLTSFQSTEQLPQSMTASPNGLRLKDFSTSPSSIYTPLDKILQNSTNKIPFLETNNTKHADALTISHSSDHRLSIGTNIYGSPEKGSSLSSSPKKLPIHRHLLSFLKNEKDGQFSLRDQLKQTEQTDQSFFTDRSILLPRLPSKTKKNINFQNDIGQFPATDEVFQESSEINSPTKRPTKLNPFQNINQAGIQKYEEDILKDWLVGKGDINMEPVLVNQINSNSIRDTVSSQNESFSPTIKQTKRPQIPAPFFGLTSSRKRQYKSPDKNNQTNNSSSFSLLNNSPNSSKQIMDIIPEILELPQKSKSIENQEKQYCINNEISQLSTTAGSQNQSNYLQAPLNPIKQLNNDNFFSQRGSVSRPLKNKLELWMQNSGRQQNDQVNDSLNLSKNLVQCSNDFNPIRQRHLQVRDSFDQVVQLQSLGVSSQEILEKSLSQESNDMGFEKQELTKQSYNEQNSQQNSNQFSQSEIVLKSPNQSHFSSSPQKFKHVRFPKVHGVYNYSANYDNQQQQSKYQSDDLERSNEIINRKTNSQILQTMNGSDKINPNLFQSTIPNSLQNFTNNLNNKSSPIKNHSPLKIQSTGNISLSLLNTSQRLILNENKSEQIIPHSVQGQQTKNITNNIEYTIPSITNFESISSNTNGSQSPLPALQLKSQQTSEKNQLDSPEQKPRYMKQNLRQLFPEKVPKLNTNQEFQTVKIIDSTAPQETARILPSQKSISALPRQQRGVLQNRELDTKQEQEQYQQQQQNLSPINETQMSNNLSDSLNLKRTLIRKKQYQQNNNNNDSSPSSNISSLSNKSYYQNQNARKRVSFQERITIVDIKTSQSTYGQLARKDEGDIH